MQSQQQKPQQQNRPHIKKEIFEQPSLAELKALQVKAVAAVPAELRAYIDKIQMQHEDAYMQPSTSNNGRLLLADRFQKI